MKSIQSIALLILLYHCTYAQETRSIDDIVPDSTLDGMDFKICNADDQIIQYFNDGKSLIRGTARGEVTEIRNPTAIRPSQHVLEPLSGYLMVASRLLEGDTKVATGFNFGPREESCVTVGEILKALQSKWSGIQLRLGSDGRLHEAHFLKLDSTKAGTELGWKPVLNFEETIQWTANWYKAHQERSDLLTEIQIAEFQKRMLTQP